MSAKGKDITMIDWVAFDGRALLLLIVAGLLLAYLWIGRSM